MPLEVEIAASRVVMADEELLGRAECLVLRRPVGPSNPKRCKF